jgi:hypothetical protein
LPREAEPSTVDFGVEDTRALEIERRRRRTTIPLEDLELNPRQPERVVPIESKQPERTRTLPSVITQPVRTLLATPAVLLTAAAPSVRVMPTPTPTAAPLPPQRESDILDLTQRRRRPPRTVSFAPTPVTRSITIPNESSVPLETFVSSQPPRQFSVPPPGREDIKHSLPMQTRNMDVRGVTPRPVLTAAPVRAPVPASSPQEKENEKEEETYPFGGLPANLLRIVGDFVSPSDRPSSEVKEAAQLLGYKNQEPTILEYFKRLREDPVMYVNGGSDVMRQFADYLREADRKGETKSVINPEILIQDFVNILGMPRFVQFYTDHETNTEANPFRHMVYIFQWLTRSLFKKQDNVKLLRIWDKILLPAVIGIASYVDFKSIPVMNQPVVELVVDYYNQSPDEMRSFYYKSWQIYLTNGFSSKFVVAFYEDLSVYTKEKFGDGRGNIDEEEQDEVRTVLDRVYNRTIFSFIRPIVQLPEPLKYLMLQTIFFQDPFGFLLVRSNAYFLLLAMLFSSFRMNIIEKKSDNEKDVFSLRPGDRIILNDMHRYTCSLQTKTDDTKFERTKLNLQQGFKVPIISGDVTDNLQIIHRHSEICRIWTYIRPRRSPLFYFTELANLLFQGTRTRDLFSAVFWKGQKIPLLAEVFKLLRTADCTQLSLFP